MTRVVILGLCLRGGDGRGVRKDDFLRAFAAAGLLAGGERRLQANRSKTGRGGLCLLQEKLTICFLVCRLCLTTSLGIVIVVDVAQLSVSEFNLIFD